MKRIMLYIIVLLLALCIPVDRTDISNLEPIQAVWINKENGNYIITTDTEDVGTGESIQRAIAEMKSKSEKIIYLDTAQYLLVNENCTVVINEISNDLKGKVRVGIWNGEGELARAARYMQTRRIGIKLKKYLTGSELPVIPG